MESSLGEHVRTILKPLLFIAHWSVDNAYSLVSGHLKRHPKQVQECAPPCHTRLCRTEPHYH